MPGEGASKLYYVLRVYDRVGRYDETKPLALSRTKEHYDQHAPQDPDRRHWPQVSMHQSRHRAMSQRRPWPASVKLDRHHLVC